LLCASTREGEEALILDAMRRIDLQDVLVIIVPRHPQRFNEVEHMIANEGISAVRRTALQQTTISDNARILLGDSMGEMFSYYAACDLAFIGGSLLPLGGQNMIEACALGKPVLLGPHTFNFNLISEDAIEAGAAVRVEDATAMLREAMRLLHADAERADRGAKALAFAQRHRGAAQRTMALLQAVLS